MALKIRLRQQGRRNNPFYRLVVIDERAPRGGRYVENVGWYNPVDTTEERNLSVDGARVQHWLSVGAQLSEKADALVKRGAPEVAKWVLERSQQAKANLVAKKQKKGTKTVAK